MAQLRLRPGRAARRDVVDSHSAQPGPAAQYRLAILPAWKTARTHFIENRHTGRRPGRGRITRALRTTVRDDIERGNLNFYAKFYPDIAQTAPSVLTDNEEQNKVEVDEFYSIQNIWAHSSEETAFHALIYAENIGAAVRPPMISAQRTMPLGLMYPDHQIFHAEVLVVASPVILPEDRTIQNQSFTSTVW